MNGKLVESSIQKLRKCIDASRKCKRVNREEKIAQLNSCPTLEVYCLCDGTTHSAVWLNENYELMVRYYSGPSFGIFEKIRINGIEHVVHGVTSFESHLRKESFVSIYVTPCYQMPWDDA